MKLDRFFFACGMLLLALAFTSFFWDEERITQVTIEETHRILNVPAGEETTISFKVNNCAAALVEVVGLAEC